MMFSGYSIFTMICNIPFLLGDMLGGHLDDMEVDWSKPIVSMRYLAGITFVFIFQSRAVNKTIVLKVIVSFFSLGCKAIFLLGGKFREDEPNAMFLRSGDIVLMAGEARECFHG